MMNIRQMVAVTGAAMALATTICAGTAHAGGRFQYFGNVYVQPYNPIYAPHPIFLNPWDVPQPIYVNPNPVVVTQPVVVTPPPVIVTPPVVVPAKVDLAVTSCKLAWARDANGMLQRMLSFQVANLGNVPAPPTVASVSLGGDPVYVAVPSILPAQSTMVSVPTSGVVSPGTMIRIVADCRNELPEPNKKNNELVARWMP